MTKEELAEILRTYKYDPKTGKLQVVKSQRIVLQPEDSASVSIYLPKSKKVKKINLSKLCWLIFNNTTEIPKGFKILHKNLNTSDNRALNLVLVPASEYATIRNAVDNLVSSLKMTTHPYDQYSYVLKYKDEGVLRTEVLHDVVPAKKRFAELQLRYAKIAGKYCNLDI